MEFHVSFWTSIRHPDFLQITEDAYVGSTTVVVQRSLSGIELQAALVEAIQEKYKDGCRGGFGQVILQFHQQA